MNWETLSQVLNYVGIPAIITWFLYDRRRIKAEARTQNASAAVAEGKVPAEVRTSSVVSLEAEIVALTKSFEADRLVKEATITYLNEELTETREREQEKDDLIDALKRQVRSMMGEVDTLQRRLAQVERELNNARQKDH